jgi:hypothetical protein
MVRQMPDGIQAYFPTVRFGHFINTIESLFDIVIDGHEGNTSFELVCEHRGSEESHWKDVILPNQDLSGLRTDAIKLIRLGNVSLQ